MTNPENSQPLTVHPLIVTVTPNPSIDRAVTLAAPLEPGAVQRAVSEQRDAGGKGINVSRALSGAGVPTIAIVPAALHDPFLALVAATGIIAEPVPISGVVRTNITLTDPDGETTKINLPGSPFTAEVVAALRDRVVAASEGARWLVLAGSLPPGAGDDLLVDLVAAVRAAHPGNPPRIAVDTSGSPLKAVIQGARPDLIKPNGEELAELLGEDPGDDPDDPQVAGGRARRVVPRLAAAALVTLGARGALLVDADGVLFAPSPKVDVQSTVGAGDSSLAGYLIAEASGADRASRLARAVAYGAAAASLPGTGIPRPADASAASITVTDRTADFPAAR